MNIGDMVYRNVPRISPGLIWFRKLFSGKIIPKKSFLWVYLRVCLSFRVCWEVLITKGIICGRTYLRSTWNCWKLGGPFYVGAYLRGYYPWNFTVAYSIRGHVFWRKVLEFLRNKEKEKLIEVQPCLICNAYTLFFIRI